MLEMSLLMTSFRKLILMCSPLPPNFAIRIKCCATHYNI